MPRAVVVLVRRPPWLALFLLLALLPGGQARLAAAPPEWLPRYDLDVNIDVAGHEVQATERVTWTNRHKRSSDCLVFNAYSHYCIPDGEIGLLAKTLEILRMMPSEVMDFKGPALTIKRITLDGVELPFHWQEENQTALEVQLPTAIEQGQSVTVAIEFSLRLPQKQGRWGQWLGVTQLCCWQPILAYYDEKGWQPTPFVPWHQPFFNEAGMFAARVRLPCDQKLACTGSIQGERDLGDGTRVVHITAPGVRDFALLCSTRYKEFQGEAGPVKIRVFAFAEHAHYAQEMVRYATDAINAYSRWIGPYPWPEFSLVESFFGWNGNECATLVMIDERVFGMPHAAGGYVEYLVSHEICHQWFYNLIGTNGFCETWMDEGPATWFSHKVLDEKGGKNTPLLKYPKGLEWLPNIHRDNYRNYGLYGTIARGDNGPVLRQMSEYGHVVNLFSMNYDKGSRIVGMIEDRLGWAGFLDFMHIIYAKYQYRVLRVEDLRRELEEYTGQSWEEFFRFWLYGPGMTDWRLEKVKVEPVHKDNAPPALAATLQGAFDREKKRRPVKVTAILKQKAECCEPTVLGISMDGTENYQIRVPIHPNLDRLVIDEPQASVEALPDRRMKVEILLPCRPTQIAIDPDGVLVDRDPSDNYWHTKVRYRVTPLYTQLEEADLTNDYDKWNILAGPWLYGPAYYDPWFMRSAMAGFRLGAYRTQEFSGGVYAAYRTDYADIALGIDGLKDHWPWPHTQVGFNAERSITQFDPNNATADRGVLFFRHIFQYGSSLYLPPMHYLEFFGAIQNHYLPWSGSGIPGAERADHQTAVGVHYRLDYLTPYWDPEGGYRIDCTYANGVPIFGEEEAFNQLLGRVSAVKALPDGLGYLSETRVAAQLYGAIGLPDQRQYFSLGGSQLLRGFNLGQRQGNAVWVSSLEWRLPIVKELRWDACDHVAGLRHIYGALFYDAGDAWLKGQTLGPVAHSVGVGLRLDVAWISMIERTMLRVDAAKVVNADTGVQFWFGVQHPF